jgi:hypothetical protein
MVLRAGAGSRLPVALGAFPLVPVAQLLLHLGQPPEEDRIPDGFSRQQEGEDQDHHGGRTSPHPAAHPLPGPGRPCLDARSVREAVEVVGQGARCRSAAAGPSPDISDKWSPDRAGPWVAGCKAAAAVDEEFLEGRLEQKALADGHGQALVRQFPLRASSASIRWGRSDRSMQDLPATAGIHRRLYRNAASCAEASSRSPALEMACATPSWFFPGIRKNLRLPPSPGWEAVAVVGAGS